MPVMKDASQYAITTPFGKVAGYELNGGVHNGVDRVMPIGTPVIVDGLLIGYSGNTGAVFPAPSSADPSAGRHLHIGCFVGGTATDPGAGGFHFQTPGYVYDTGQDASNGKYVRIQADGALWCYLHLSQITAVKNQVVSGPAGGRGGEGEDMANMTHDEAIWCYRLAFGFDPSESEVSPYVGKSYEAGQKDIQRYAFNNGKDFVAYRRSVAEQLTALQNQLQNATDRAAVGKVIERCTVDVTNMPSDKLSLLQKIAALFKS
jgi:hypothetical protein